MPNDAMLNNASFACANVPLPCLADAAHDELIKLLVFVQAALCSTHQQLVLGMVWQFGNASGQAPATTPKYDS